MFIKKIPALLTAATMMLSASNIVFADYSAEITDIQTDDTVTMTVNKTDDTVSGRAIAAVYSTDGQLIGIEISDEISAEETGEITVDFENLTVSDDSIIKGYIWKTDENGALTVEPMAEAFTPEDQATFAPVVTATPEATEDTGDTDVTPTPAATEDTDDTETTGYTGTFVTDEHATINVYYTQDYTTANETNVTSTIARNSDDGEITTDSTLKPQINFLVVLQEGYEVASVTVEPEGNYNALKGPSDTGVENLYRITKIVGDITITVTTTESSGLPELDDGVISAFRYSTETEISGENTEGDVSAAITASVDGTTETALELNSTDYTDETLEISPRLTPVLGASETAPWGESPYVQVALSTVNYTDIMVSAKVGATKKGPASYKLQYSTDGETFTDVENTTYTLESNKTLYEAFSKVELGDDANECETLYIRIVPDGTTTLNDGTLTGATGGEFAVNDILIYGTSTGDGIIHLADNNITATGISNVTVDNENSTVTISAAGTYTIEGTLTDGQIIVAASDKSEEVYITLDNVSVASSTADAQPFSATKGQIYLTPTGTCSFTATGDGTAAVYSRNDMEIKCDAKTDYFYATSSSGKGIHCKADLQIGKGNFVVDAGADGIQGNDSVKITAKNNTVDVTSKGDGIRSNLDPSTDTDGTYVSGGTVTINGGEITVNAQDDADGTNDGIQADTLLTVADGTLDITATGEALKANASSIAYLEDSTAAETPADGDGCILISGGTITASAGEDGIKAVKNVTISDGSVTLTKALDGIQVNEIIYNTDGETVLYHVDGEIDIEGGTLDITSTEDGIQCKTGDINISDGTITVNATLDGIQSSCNLNIDDGTFDVTTGGGAIDPTKVEDDEDAESCKGLKASGNLTITAGDITVNSYDDSIHSNSSVYIGVENDSNAVPTIDVTSSDDGVHADVYLVIYNGDITVENSYEGLEGAEIYIYDGTMIITATDDGINGAGDDPNSDETASTSSVELMAGPDDSSSGSSSGGESGGSSGGGESGGGSSSGGPGQDGSQGGTDQGGDDASDYGYIEVNGGYIYMTITSTGDGFDSNGSLLITDGVSVVNGCTESDCDGIDFGDSTGDEIDITGGYVIAVAAEGMATINSLTQTTAKLGYGTTTSNQSTGFSGNVGGNQQQGGGSISTGSSSKISTGDYCIVGADGTVICAFSYTKSSFGQVLISTPNMTNQTYYIRPLTVSGASADNMLYGAVDSETYAFTLASGCTEGTSNSATLTTISQ
ncbi:MAG: carbohydrate-binding domain-containing protein [Firmicutes bacterium]|nr:carbohydrate-binding domain-containing protein [Bacillota bacterium]